MFLSRTVSDEEDQGHALVAMIPYIEGVNAARLQKIQSKQASGDKTDVSKITSQRRVSSLLGGSRAEIRPALLAVPAVCDHR